MLSLAEFGTGAGLAFQLADDMLGIWGAPDVTGKPVGSDLRARKKSVPVVAALTSGTEASTELATLLAGPEPLTEQQVERATWLVEQAGGRDQTEAMAAKALDSAFGCLGRADMPEDVRGRVRRDRRVHHGAPMVAAPGLARSADPAGLRRHGRAHRAGPGGRPPDRPAGPGRLVAGRAGNQRHDGRRGPAAARVPRHPDRRGDARRRPAGSGPASEPDGTWANFRGGDADLSTTVEAYTALRLAGDSPEAPHMATAASWIRARGGIEATRVFTRIWLALFGEWQWDDLPVMPPELIYLPRWFPLNVYDWACWARQTIVPLTVVCSFRPVRPLPFTLTELRGYGRTGGDRQRAAGPVDYGLPGPGQGPARLRAQPRPAQAGCRPAHRGHAQVR